MNPTGSWAIMANQSGTGPQDHHFRLTPPSLGLCIIANDSLTEIPGQCHLQPLEGYH